MRLGVTLAIGLVINVGMWAVIVVMPSVQAEFGIDRADASMPYTVTMIGFAIGNLLIGRAVDRWGVAWSMIGAAGLAALSYVLAAINGSVLTITILHFFLGFGTAAGFGPLIADISLWFHKRRGIAVAIAASGNYLSGAIWPIVLSGILAEYSWRGAYLALALLTIIVVVPLSLLLRKRAPLDDVPQMATGPMGHTTAFSPTRLQWLLALAGIGCCVAMSMPQVHIVAFCVDLGYGPAVGAEMLSLMLLGGVVSRLISGLLADRLGGVMTLLIGSSLQCLALFLYLPYDGLVPLYIISLIFGLSQGGIVPAYAVIVREYMPAREAGARVGFVLMATIIGMALGGWMSGWIYDVTGSYQWAFLNGIVWNFLNIAIMILILMKGRRGGLRAVPAAS